MLLLHTISSTPKSNIFHSRVFGVSVLTVFPLPTPSSSTRPGPCCSSCMLKTSPLSARIGKTAVKKNVFDMLRRPKKDYLFAWWLCCTLDWLWRVFMKLQWWCKLNCHYFMLHFRHCRLWSIIFALGIIANLKSALIFYYCLKSKIQKYRIWWCMHMKLK